MIFTHDFLQRFNRDAASDDASMQTQKQWYGRLFCFKARKDLNYAREIYRGSNNAS